MFCFVEKEQPFPTGQCPMDYKKNSRGHKFSRLVQVTNLWLQLMLTYCYSLKDWYNMSEPRLIRSFLTFSNFPCLRLITCICNYVGSVQQCNNGTRLLTQTLKFFSILDIDGKIMLHSKSNWINFIFPLTGRTNFPVLSRSSHISSL